MSDGKHSRATFIFTFIVVSCGIVGYFVGLQSPMNPGERRTAGFAANASAIHSNDGTSHSKLGSQQFVVLATDYSDMAAVTSERAQRWKTKIADLKSSVDLMADVVISPEEKLLALARRNEIRAFNGAPPTIPHPVNEMPSQACAACHTDGAKTESLRIPAMSHPFLTNCTQCHVESSLKNLQKYASSHSNDLWVGNSFVGLPAPTEGQRAYEGAPPQIPHSVWMRQSCASCHGVTGLHGIRATHPWRNNCQQCHVGQSVTNQELVSEPKFLPALNIKE